MTQTSRTHIQPVTQQSRGSCYWLWFDNYLKAVIGIAVLGSQITFTLIVSDIADPQSLDNGTHAVFKVETVRLLIALSCLFFTCTLGVAVIISLLFTGDSRFGGVWRSVVTLLLNFLPITAFTLLSLATVAYVPIVGWIGTGCIALFALTVSYFWIFGSGRAYD
jgi:hypothetical protein